MILRDCLTTTTSKDWDDREDQCEGLAPDLAQWKFLQANLSIGLYLYRP